MLEPKLRVFLDSNVIFSGLYSSERAPGKILEYFISGRLNVVISRQVLEEVVRVIKEKLPEALPLLRDLLFSASPEIVADPAPEVVRLLMKKLSAGDAAVLGAAIAAKPDYFITGDNHFLADPGLAKEAGLVIGTPAQFLKVIDGGEKWP